MKASSVTAIVLNWCAEDDTAACLESLAASRYPTLTTLLVDNGSPDGSGERLRQRFPHVPYLQTGANLGYAGGNNRGMEWALEHGADYLLVVNDDAMVDPDCVDALVRAAEETGAAAVGPEIRYFDDPELVSCGAGYFSTARALGIHREERRAKREERRESVSFVSGCCVLLRSAVVRQLGAFDESFFAYVEDAELSHRYSRAGQTLVYEPAGQVLHRAIAGAPPSPFQIRQRERNRRRLVARHYGAFDRVRFALWFYPTRLAHLARYLMLGDRGRATAIIAGTFGR